ncbi:MAG: DUF378 domain-containing protein [Clostridia bacterium]|nr:DUF378 domain-containing protein [Clostridia bacterium]
MIVANVIAFILLLIGGLNWGLVGIFQWNLVEAIFGVGFVTSAIYILVLASAVWLLISSIARHRIQFNAHA